ncbi:MAG: hypothetical protein A2Y40_08665 [Candidatus Margulisbacteria bacterium GWF2_35_9]|nr:MAG: hypothetical protein A2Y40_08665 [Candidatus Margulisbacteria bacterium GWF2_35_9]
MPLDPGSQESVLLHPQRWNQRHPALQKSKEAKNRFLLQDNLFLYIRGSCCLYCVDFKTLWAFQANFYNPVVDV